MTSCIDPFASSKPRQTILQTWRRASLKVPCLKAPVEDALSVPPYYFRPMLTTFNTDAPMADLVTNVSLTRIFTGPDSGVVGQHSEISDSDRQFFPSLLTHSVETRTAGTPTLPTSFYFRAGPKCNDELFDSFWYLSTIQSSHISDLSIIKGRCEKHGPLRQTNDPLLESRRQPQPEHR